MKRIIFLIFPILYSFTFGLRISPPSIEGGTELKYTNYKSRTFTTSGNLIIKGRSQVIDYMIVGGGGGGGSGATYSGGGGAGGLIIGSIKLEPGTYQITIGAGGTPGINGTDSKAFGLTAVGGGHGANANSTAGTAGGSGGGGTPSSYLGGTATINQGYQGGSGSPQGAGAVDSSAGSGGGAGGAGGGGAGNAATRGGNGIENNFQDGTMKNYAGGGSGTGVYNSYGGSSINGGTIVGGSSNPSTSPKINGDTNTGSGGAGSCVASSQHAAQSAGSGGSGVVIIRFINN